MNRSYSKAIIRSATDFPTAERAGHRVRASITKWSLISALRTENRKRAELMPSRAATRIRIRISRSCSGIRSMGCVGNNTWELVYERLNLRSAFLPIPARCSQRY